MTMAKDKSRQDKPGELRRRAEDALSTKKTGEPSIMPEKDVRALVHELQVHQIELEMQNEELKRANAEVEETRNRYVDLYELAPNGYLTLAENGTVLEANLTVAVQLGIERSGLIKRPFQGYIVPADRDKFRSHLNEVVTSEKRQSCEIGLMTKSGSNFYALLDTVFILDSSGRKLCRTTATDITERKLIEDIQVFLAQSGWIASGEDFFESLARYLGQSLGMDYVCIDRLDGDLLSARTLAIYFDGKFEDNVTYTLEDTPCSEVVEKKVCCFPKGVRHLFPRDEVLQEMKAESYVGTILWGSKGQPIGLIAVIGRQPLANRHLTESVLQLAAIRAAGELERKWVEDELRKSRDELELRVRERTTQLSQAVAKLESMNQELQEFAFVASHDLQEPLRKIQAFGNMLITKHKDSLNPQGQDYMDRITKAANRMSGLLRSLLDYSRTGTSQLNYKPVSLTEVANDAASDLEFLIKKAKGNVEVSELPTVDADAPLLRQLFQNVIENSIKYRKESVPPVVKIYGRISDGTCQVMIEDNGIGFDECYSHKIFKPFERLHGKNAPYSGTGMGLAICKKIVNRHGGQITVRSVPEQGTTFIVTLPIEQEKGS
jgi:PAS domain S-box-containing protein